MRRKGTIAKWVKAHKKELFIVGCAFIAVIVIIGTKRGSLKGAMWKTGATKGSVGASVCKRESTTISKFYRGRQAHDVVGHIRKLPKGSKASAEKLATAASHGYRLRRGETWVKSYRTGRFA